MEFNCPGRRRARVRFLFPALVLGMYLLLPAVMAADGESDGGLLVPDIALSSGIQDRFARLRGVAPADYDLDGDIDVFLSSTGDSSRFFWNMGVDGGGDVIFEKGEVLVYGEAAYFTSTADYDNDGDPDLFIGIGGIDSRGFDYLFENVDGSFVDVTRQAGVAGRIDAMGDTLPGATGGGAWGDYDNDGLLDLYVTTHLVDSTSPRNTLYRNMGGGVFADVTDSAGVGEIGSSWAPSWLDYDNDGYLDLYVANRSGDNTLYHNDGDGTFTDVTSPELALPYNSWGSLADDFNNDGWMDILAVIRNGGDEGLHGFFINDGQGGFTNEALSSGLNIPGDPTTFSNWMGFQAGDLTNDGYPEIYLGAGSPGAGNDNILYSRDRVCRFRR